MAVRRAAAVPPFGLDPIIVAYGMGVDSTAMLIGLRDRRVRIEMILFADTGSEKPETMAYLPIIQSWLTRNKMPPVTVIKRHSPRAGDTSLHAECLRNSVLPSLAYGGHSCSLKWKVDPQWRFTQRHFGWGSRRQTWPHGPHVTSLSAMTPDHATAAASLMSRANGRRDTAIAIPSPNGAGPAKPASM